MSWLHAALVAIGLAATSAGAQEIPAVSLAPGDAVTVRFDDGGRVGEPERGQAQWSRFDLYAASQLAGMTPPDVPMREGIPIDAPAEVVPEPVPAGEVRIRFLSIDDRHSLLVVENGQGRALRYRARMTVSGRARHTDVCVVLPRLPSYEHWAHPIERLELTHFEFIAWPPGRNPTCE